MGDKSTVTAFSADSTELDSFFNNPSTTAIPDDSIRDVDIEGRRCCNSQRLIVGIIVLLGVICLITGIVLLSLAKERKECDVKTTPNPQKREEKNIKAVNACAPSKEAMRVSLYNLLDSVQAKAFELNPNMLIYKPQVTKEEIRQNCKPYDPTPSEIKRRTDEAWRLLAKINDTDIDLAKLKPRERKAISQAKLYLRHVFGLPYGANYYNADWMLGPNFFCWHPICYIGQEMSGHLASFAPKNTSDMDAIREILKAYKKSIIRYIENVKLGVRSGMVGSIEECRAGLDVMKSRFSQIAISKEGMRQQITPVKCRPITRVTYNSSAEKAAIL